MLKDLKPYVCLFPSCPEPEKLYGRFAEWKAHLLHAHKRVFYICPFRDTDEKYTSIGAIKEHMYEMHTSAFNETQMSGILKNQEKDQYQNLFFDCPLCGFLPDHALSSERMLLQHIANHLEVISLISIPLSMANYDDKDPTRSSLPTSEFTQSTLSWNSPTSSSLKRRDDEWDRIVGESDDPALQAYRHGLSRLDLTRLTKPTQCWKGQQENGRRLRSSSSEPKRTIRLHLDSHSLH